MFSFKPHLKNVIVRWGLNYAESQALFVITIVLVGTVTVSSVFGIGGSVEHDAHLLEALVLVKLVDVGYEFLLKQSGAHHEERAVGVAFDNLCIDNHVDGRTVDKDVVEFLL